MKTAILVDGGFYRKRALSVIGAKSPKDRADELEKYCRAHLRSHNENNSLYRVFYYDCLPSDKIVYHPLTKKQVDLSKSLLNTWMKQFIDELKHRRKFAMRLGVISDSNAAYTLTSRTVKKLCNGTLSISDLTEEDFYIDDLNQKGVDMKIGIDIASLAYKKQVDQIILISGDSDFVPAAKLARREGIDFILDAMGQHILPDLYEHIDGLRSADKAYTSANRGQTS